MSSGNVPRPSSIGSAEGMRAPKAVRWIVRTLEDAGYETWAVGGAVRDALAGDPSGDWDLTTRAEPGTVRKLFKRSVPIGIDHGTVGVLARDGTLYEVTTFRRDVETTGRHAVVEFADSVEEDLARRDFTINAVAWHPIRGELRDPFGGVDDLQERRLRTVGSPDERFREDYLRVLRGLRFAGVFGLTVDPDSWRGLVRGVPFLDRLSAERVREELLKVLGGAGRPSRSLALYAASGALARLAPELNRLVGEDRRDGGDDDLWSHALRTVDLLPPHRPRLRLAALFTGVGWPEAQSRDRGRKSPGPRERAALRAAAVLERLRFSNDEIRHVVGLAGWSGFFPEGDPGDEEIRRWLAGAGREQLHGFFRLWWAEARANACRGAGPGPDTVLRRRWRIREVLSREPALKVGELALDGRDLIRMGYRPGPHFGRVLEYLLDRVLEAPDANDPETLARWASEYLEAAGVSPASGPGGSHER